MFPPLAIGQAGFATLEHARGHRSHSMAASGTADMVAEGASTLGAAATASRFGPVNSRLCSSCMIVKSRVRRLVPSFGGSRRARLRVSKTSLSACSRLEANTLSGKPTSVDTVPSTFGHTRVAHADETVVGQDRREASRPHSGGQIAMNAYGLVA